MQQTNPKGECVRSRVVRICVLRGAARPRGAAPALSARGRAVAATPRGAHRWRRVDAGGGASSSGAPRHRGLPAPGLTTLIRSGWQRRPWPPPRPAWCPRPALRVGVSVCSAQLGSAQLGLASPTVPLRSLKFLCFAFVSNKFGTNKSTTDIRIIWPPRGCPGGRQIPPYRCGF